MVSYCAATQGAVGLSAALCAEAKSQGWSHVHVCTVMPGDFAMPNAHEAAASGSVLAAPAVQTSVLDEVFDAILDLVRSPRDVVHVKGAHYFL